MGKKSSSQRKREAKKFRREKRHREQAKKKASARERGAGAGHREREYARDLIETAKQAPVAEAREALAREALQSDPDCADAYLMLADDAASTPGAAVGLCEQAVAAADRSREVVVPDKEDEDEDERDDAAEMPPEDDAYLRARLALVRALAKDGKVTAAEENLDELLRLDPGDRFGARQQLASLLSAGKPSS